MARIPALDAIMHKFFSDSPMNLRGFLSIYGGLVPLGFTHSNFCHDFSCLYRSPLFYHISAKTAMDFLTSHVDSYGNAGPAAQFNEGLLSFFNQLTPQLMLPFPN